MIYIAELFAEEFADMFSHAKTTTAHFVGVLHLCERGVGGDSRNKTGLEYYNIAIFTIWCWYDDIASLPLDKLCQSCFYIYPIEFLWALVL